MHVGIVDLFVVPLPFYLVVFTCNIIISKFLDFGIIGVVLLPLSAPLY